MDLFQLSRNVLSSLLQMMQSDWLLYSVKSVVDKDGEEILVSS